MDSELAALVPLLPNLDFGDIAGSRAMLGLAPAGGTTVETIRADGVVISSRRIPGAPGGPEVPVRIYRPEADGFRPVLVYFHGGGFVLGQVQLFDTMCKNFATEVDAVVVSVDYRLAPEDPFTAAVDDCYAALSWAVSQAEEAGIDPTRVAVGGLSAGGGLAAAIPLLARDRGGPEIAFQLLINPMLDDRLGTVSSKSFTDTPLWRYRDAAAAWDLYLGAERAEVSPYAAPARATDFAGLPPAYVLTSEFDPLRDEGIAYAARMLEAGVPVELHNMAGTFHGFDAFPTAISRTAVAEQHAALRKALGTSRG
jgi:acetyl esterase